MTDSETTRLQKESTLKEIVYQLAKIRPEDLDKYYYQDLRRVRNALRKALREARVD